MPDRFIKASDINALKAAVKAEMLRRNLNGSVASYGGAEYDFSNTAATNNPLFREHYDKSLTPLLAVNPTPTISGTVVNLPQAVARIVYYNDVKALEDAVNYFKSIDKNAAVTGCAASCTGLCSGCSVNCASTCTGSCYNICTDACTGGCGNTCFGCSNTCQGLCWGSCTDNCTRTCGVGCWAYCSSNCGEYCYAGCGGEAESYG